MAKKFTKTLDTPDYKYGFKKGYTYGFDDAKKEIKEWLFHELITVFTRTEHTSDFTSRLLNKLEITEKEEVIDEKI